MRRRSHEVAQPDARSEPRRLLGARQATRSAADDEDVVVVGGGGGGGAGGDDEWDGGGEWEVRGERATFWLAHRGLARGDVTLEPGRVYFNAPCWGALLGKRGTLTIKQRRLGWLPFLPAIGEGSFIVGTFSCAARSADEPPLGATLPMMKR